MALPALASLADASELALSIVGLDARLVALVPGADSGLGEEGLLQLVVGSLDKIIAVPLAVDTCSISELLEAALLATVPALASLSNASELVLAAAGLDTCFVALGSSTNGRLGKDGILDLLVGGSLGNALGVPLAVDAYSRLAVAGTCLKAFIAALERVTDSSVLELAIAARHAGLPGQAPGTNRGNVSSIIFSGRSLGGGLRLRDGDARVGETRNAGSTWNTRDGGDEVGHLTAHDTVGFAVGQFD